MRIPQHVAIILDGSREDGQRSKRMPRNYGHTIGAKRM